MKNKVKNYSIESIELPSYFDGIRHSIGMYIGSRDVNGLHHLAKEIISNSIDEYLSGNCTKIVATLHKDGSFSVLDDGRGIPIGKVKDEQGREISGLDACFTVAHAGGKNSNGSEKSGYNSSGGQHGTGTKCVNALSDKLITRSTRDGQRETITYEHGLNVSDITEKWNKQEHGQYVQFWPSAKYLETIEFEPERLKTLLQELSFLSKGLTIEFVDEKNKENNQTFYSANGLTDFVEFLTGEDSLISGPFHYYSEEGTFSVEVAFGYNNTNETIIKLFTNSIPQDSGTHLTGFTTAFTQTLNSFARDKKWLKDKDENLIGSDFEEGRVVALNFKMINPDYKGQNKEIMSSPEGKTYVQKLSNVGLTEIFLNNEKDIKVIVEKAVNARKARIAAQKAKETARGLNKLNKKTKNIDLPTKLVDANPRDKDRSKCELYLVEGNSAANGLITTRDSQFQGVMPLRGKILSVRKAKVSEMEKNQEIENIVKSLGLKVNPDYTLQYNKKALRYDKLVIATDADPDGYAIRNLLITLFWRLCPELVMNGHLYVAVPPLYRITDKSNNFTYLENDQELDAYRKKHKGEKYLINRNKGLGEQDADELSMCLLNPKTRNIVQLVADDFDAVDDTLEVFQGKNTDRRKQYYIDNWQNY